MPGLFARSVAVLSVLFGILFAIGMAVTTYCGLPPAFALAIALAVGLLQYLLSPWVIGLIYRIDWVRPEDVNPQLADALKRVCTFNGIAVPRFGVIQDGNPNAFTFGHYPGDARLVVTRGLLDMLDQSELEAVVAHELGHIVHWDFVVMTLASLVPLLLYAAYVATRDGGRSRRRESAAAVAALSYLAYVLSEYIVLLLSRTREYYADEFAAYTTQNPNALSVGLVKVCYGLASSNQANENQRRPSLSSVVRHLGIFDPKWAASLAMASAAAAGNGTVTRDSVADAMRWDLWNPWALVYELGSSHPLPAKRLKALSRVAIALGQTPVYDLSEPRPESYWDEFVGDLLVAAMPGVGFVVGLGALAYLAQAGLVVAGIGALFLCVGAGLVIRLLKSYPNGPYAARSVESLVREPKVSGVRCIPCRLQGRIIGRGIPGLFYSKDLVLRDGSGFITLDYRQPLRILDWLFGAFLAHKTIGEDAVAYGWYRRSPRPYVELLSVSLKGGGELRCHTYLCARTVAWGCCALGAGVLLAAVAL